MRYSLFAVLLVACTQAEPPVTSDELVAPRPAKTFDPTDYAAEVETYRLLGIERGDGTLPRSAIVADTKTWSTHTLHEGDLLGRTARVHTIDDRGLTLARTTDTLRLERGRDLTLRVAHHRLDVVATPRGNHRHTLNVDAAREARSSHGVGAATEPVEVWDRHFTKITTLDPEGLLAKAGFHEGDLLEISLEDLAEILTTPTPSTTNIVRNGVPMALRFDPI